MTVLLPAGSALTRPCPRSVSILSWNVLLPNSRDGWWLYKYYPPSVPAAATRWEARRALLQQTIATSEADIVCLQECSALSFASDFDFFLTAGYSAALHGKGRMRPATFWRSDRLRLCGADGAELPPFDAPRGEAGQILVQTKPPLDEPLGPVSADAVELAGAGGPSDPFDQPQREAGTVLIEAELPPSKESLGPVSADAVELTGADKPGELSEAALVARLEAKRPGILHGDRTLTTCFRVICSEDGGDVPGCPPLWVVNCHLSAGPEARRRLRQVHEAMEAIRKARGGVQARPQPTPVGPHHGIGATAGAQEGAQGGLVLPPAAVVVCGDMNSQGRSAVRELLQGGRVSKAFRESGDPTEARQAGEEVTSKERRQEIGRFACAYAWGGAQAGAVAAGGEAGGNGSGDASDEPALPPPTMYGPLLAPAMQRPDGAMSPALASALTECFATLSGGEAALDPAATDAWLKLINGSPDRGSESRGVAACRAESGSERLSLVEFLRIYQGELDQGKYWGVEHDLRVIRGSGLWVEGSPPFTAAFDQLYYTAGTLSLCGVLEPVSVEEREALMAGRTWLPNEWAPSDHLPIGAVVTLEGEGQESG
jgi:endonuclease/exonuclease/phosphatase family metal-dependent hydrolase